MVTYLSVANTSPYLSVLLLLRACQSYDDAVQSDMCHTMPSASSFTLQDTFDNPRLLPV